VEKQESCFRTGSKRTGEGVEEEWTGLKDCLLAASAELCGKTKGRKHFRETWWWNDVVAEVIKEKRRRFLAWRNSKSEVHKEAYYQVRREARKAVAKAQEEERKKFGDMLNKADEKRQLFRVAKQMSRQYRDVVGGGCVKDQSG